jgi:outer membrane protein assembly factor BamE (lipoprotein component of BamABCDE complex)
MRKLIFVATVVAVFLMSGCAEFERIGAMGPNDLGLGRSARGIGFKGDAEAQFVQDQVQQRVQQDMTHEQVIAVMGEPDTKKNYTPYVDADEVWGYTLDQHATRAPGGKYNAVVFFGNGKVVYAGLNPS